jgi:hypothetical protein
LCIQQKMLLDNIKNLELAESSSPSPHVTASLGGGDANSEAVISPIHNPLLEMAESLLGNS